MKPGMSSPGPGASAEEWNIWWRNWVMNELDRLNEAIKKLTAEVADKNAITVADIRELNVKMVIYGTIGGFIATAIFEVGLWWISRGH